ncbi:MAG: sulfatase-like hydrolase/transferase, partial [Nocardioides sp.]
MNVDSRRAVVTVLAMVAAAALAAGVARPATAEAVEAGPNIVLIMTDDQTYESLQYMANVQELAATGTTFTNYHANFALCCPSRVTTITGQYVHNHGVWTNDDGYPALVPNAGNALPVWLRQAGYRTMLVGKYINGYRHAVHGVPPGWDVWRAKVRGVGVNDYYDVSMADGEERQQYTGYATDTIGQIGIDEVTSSPAGQPFFLWLTFNAPHFGNPDDPEDPVGEPVPSASPRPDHRDAFEGLKAPSRGTAAFNERDVSDKPRHIRRMPLMSPEVRLAVDEAYSQQLETLQAVDEWVGRLREALAQTGRLD